MTEHATTPKELHRSRSDRYLAGVCGGLADYFELHPAFFRVGFVVLLLLGGAGLLAYIAAVLVIPDEGHDDSIAAEALRDRDRPWAAIGLGLIALAGLALLSHATYWPSGNVAFGLLLIAGAVILWAQRRSGAKPAPGSPTVATSTDEPTLRRRAFPLGVVALGLLVAAAGILALLDQAGVDIRWDVAAAVGAVLLGVAAVVAAFFRLRVGGVLVLAILLGATAVAAATIDIHIGEGIGDRSYHPSSVAALQRDYSLGIGDLQVDLSRMQLPAGETRVDASVGIGHLLVVLPRDASVRVDGDVSIGDSRVLGANREDAVDPVAGSGRRIILKADVGMGQLVVERAVR
jgi:phage shock protein PspC (stress-responsive transcriptional regulator)